MLQKAFDTYAKNYDEDFTSSSIGILQRKRVYYFMKKYLDGKPDVLEINCGTGEDAKYMTGFGCTITATDISSEMIQIGREKNAKKVEFINCDTRHLSSFLGDRKFDFVFSNFGGLNCLAPQEINQFVGNAFNLLNEKGKLIFVVMGRKCFWERFYFFYKRDKRKNRRLQKEGVKTILNGEHFTTYYYSPNELYNSFKESFTLYTQKPVGLFIPPSYLNPFFKDKKIFLKVLDFMERVFGGFSFFANYADHYLIVMQKK